MDLSDAARIVLFQVSILNFVPMRPRNTEFLRFRSFLLPCHESDLLETDSRPRSLSSFILERHLCWPKQPTQILHHAKLTASRDHLGSFRYPSALYPLAALRLASISDDLLPTIDHDQNGLGGI
jgi:hypothetical protein